VTTDAREPGEPSPGTTLLFEVWLVSRATVDLLDRVLEPAGLDADEFAVYSVLTGAEAMTPTDLARWMAAPPTTVSSYVKRFEARGHVRREKNPDDGRSYLIRLTPAGRRVHQQAAARFGPALNAVRGALDHPEDDVRAALLDLRRALDQVRRTSP
jgi:DNA-binding MarR family transcriptional regulator